MPVPKYVLAIVFESENNVLLTGTWAYARSIFDLGYHVIVLDLKKPEAFDDMYKVLASGEVLFAYGLQGVGSQLKVQGMNLWTAAKTPFLCLHFDHPSHCIPNHIPNSPYIVNLYSYPSFLETFQKFILPIRNEDRISGQISINSQLPKVSSIPFDNRPIKMLYAKSGVLMEPYAHHINSLPSQMRDDAWDQVNEALKNPNLSLCDLAAQLFPKDTFYAAENQVEFWALVKAMDLYIRHKHAIDFVNWLKFQDGAVIVGNGWDTIDKRGAKAIFKPSIDSTELIPLYHQSQLVCNTNPYGADMVHERVITGLLTGCGVITDTNAWTDSNMAHIPNLIRFSWDKPLGDQLTSQILETARYAHNLDISREEAKTLFNCSSTGSVMLEYAKQARLFGDSLSP